jgi:hypothetical protein
MTLQTKQWHIKGNELKRKTEHQVNIIWDSSIGCLGCPKACIEKWNFPKFYFINTIWTRDKNRQDEESWNKILPALFSWYKIIMSVFNCESILNNLVLVNHLHQPFLTCHSMMIPSVNNLREKSLLHNNRLIFSVGL